MIFTIPLNHVEAAAIARGRGAPAAEKPGPVNVAIAVEVFLKWTKINVNGAVLYWNGVVRSASTAVQEALWRLLYVRISENNSHNEKSALSRTQPGTKLLLQTRFYGTRRPTIPASFIASHQEYDFYGSIVLQRGTEPARSALRSGKTVLCALRKSSSTLANKGKGSYDDKIAVLRGSGYNRHASSFVACTEPGAQYAQRAAPASGGGTTDSRYASVKFNKSEGLDVNKDGIKEVGRLIEGTYQYFEKSGGHLKDRAFHVKVKQVAERDTDGDGLFTAKDSNRIDTEGAQTSMYIHRGGANNVLEPDTWSAGCQTIPNNLYKSFMSAVGPASASFYYVLVNTESN